MKFATAPHEFSKIITARVGAEKIDITSPSGLNYAPGIAVTINGVTRASLTITNARRLVAALIAALPPEDE
ncbi:hypothetical protein AB0323_06675 [Arthrobacter sp. NPDC080031]|uniref:hypothetical protein n=1 Tax=Arthrobacter sp. NPDC080031 TaxID=3155918 RepID=UPI00344CAA9A